MKEPISFFVAGIPKPAGSKRAFVIKSGGVYTGRAIVTDACKTSKDWKIDVKHEAQRNYDGDVWDCASRVNFSFVVVRPKSHFRSGKNEHLLRDSAPKFPTTKPDVDKLSRAVLDSLTGIVFIDDSIVTTKTVTKRFGTRPGVSVLIQEEYD